MDGQRSAAFSSDLSDGRYSLRADALVNGAYISGPSVTVTTGSNHTPVSQAFGPSTGSSTIYEARASNSFYNDEDGLADIVECALRIQQGDTFTTAFYNVTENKLYLQAGKGQLIGGFAPGSSNPITNSLVTLNCSTTTVSTNQANKQVQVRWNLTPKAPLVGTNDVLMDVTDRLGTHAGFVSRASWAVTNSAPAPVNFAPPNGSSRLGNPYATNAIYTDANGADDIFYCMIEIRHGIDNDATRAYYNTKLNRLYLRNDANDG